MSATAVKNFVPHIADNGDHKCEPCMTLTELGLDKLPAGKYAMANKRTGKVHFFRVTYGREGTRWQGYAFVEELSGDNTRKIYDRNERTQVLKAIERCPLGCMAFFGLQIGECGKCGKTLTSDWRLRGIGPECFKNYGE